MLNYSFFPVGQDNARRAGPSSTFDMDKLKSTIKQFVRDWSEAGKTERDSCYMPIIEEIQKQFPPEKWCVFVTIYLSCSSVSQVDEMDRVKFKFQISILCNTE